MLLCWLWWRKMVLGLSKAIRNEKLIVESMVWILPGLPGPCAPREIQEQTWTSRVKFGHLHHVAAAFWVWFWTCPHRIYICRATMSTRRLFLSLEEYRTRRGDFTLLQPFTDSTSLINLPRLNSQHGPGSHTSEQTGSWQSCRQA